MISTRVSLLLSIVAITLCQFVALGQTKRVEIHGQVRFAQSGTPAEHVIVRLESYDGGGALLWRHEIRARDLKFPRQ